jgi:hypothetical protein
MWDAWPITDWFLITTNPIRRKDGAVVMGRGMAKQAADRFPKLPYHFGQVLDTVNKNPVPHYVGTIGRYWLDGHPYGVKVGYFMVKDHWRNPASLDIIKRATGQLITCLDPPPFTHERVDLNFPGIGNGKLKREDVLPLLEELPDNVHVWEYA